MNRCINNYMHKRMNKDWHACVGASTETMLLLVMSYHYSYFSDISAITDLLTSNDHNQEIFYLYAKLLSVFHQLSRPECPDGGKIRRARS